MKKQRKNLSGWFLLGQVALVLLYIVLSVIFSGIFKSFMPEYVLVRVVLSLLIISSIALVVESIFFTRKNKPNLLLTLLGIAEFLFFSGVTVIGLSID